MPTYTYRRTDGTTFDVRQKFTDDPLTVDPATGQPVERIVQAVGIVFKGSGFYVNDSKGGKNPTISKPDAAKTDAPAKTDASTSTATSESSAGGTSSAPSTPSTPVASSAAD